LVRYDVLGFKSEDDYLTYFFDTLLRANWTYSYFVDWKKVREKIRKYVTEIHILNSLTKIETVRRKEKLIEIFINYPETLSVIPSIIALREKSIPILEMGERIFYKIFNFSKRRLTKEEAKDLADFCEKTGILRLFGEISDLYAYLMGVEVGIDTNARKNRSGKIFQNFVEVLLRKQLRDLDIYIKSEDPSIRVKRRKKADFVIYHKANPKVIIECSFYNTPGGKPIATANAYIDLQRKIREKNLSFIWITDGPGWKKMKKTIIQSFKEMDFPMNYTIANEKINKIISFLLNY